VQSSPSNPLAPICRRLLGIIAVKLEGTPPRESLRRFLTFESLRESLPLLVAAVLFVVAVVFLGAQMKHHIHALEAWIEDLGPWAELTYVGFFVIASSIIVPETILCILAGALFGLGHGILAVLLGTLVACPLQYWLSRRFLRARIQRALGKKPALDAIRRAVVQDEIRLQFLLRLAPFNPALMSYLLGATGVRFRGFMLACLAIVPHVLIEVYFGHVGKHVVQLAEGERRVDRMHVLSVACSVVIALVVLVLVSRAARKALMQAVGDPVSADAAPDAKVE
jgi:uncharacterized membrane protein YdjX (TVP38/TMEM64 family)